MTQNGANKQVNQAQPGRHGGCRRALLFLVDTSSQLVDSSERIIAGYKWVKGRYDLRIGRFRKAPAVGSIKGTWTVSPNLQPWTPPLEGTRTPHTWSSHDGERSVSWSRALNRGVPLNHAVLLGIVFFLLVLPSCSDSGGTDADSKPTGSVSAPGGEASLRAAVDRFWEYRVARDYDSMYDNSLSRSEQAKFDTRALFRSQKGGVRYHGYEIEEIHVEGDTGTATVSFFWTHNISEETAEKFPNLVDREPGEETVRSAWILEGGEWRRSGTIDDQTP